MSLSFDIANDKFTRGIIRRKLIQISQRLGFSEQDLESLKQTMLTKVIKAMPSFNPDIAHRNVFITTVVERHAARLSILTPPHVTRGVIQQAIAAGVKNIWMQPGAEDDKASQAARDAGLNVIDDGSCVLVLMAIESKKHQH